MNNWRMWHRWFGTLAGLFLLFLALSGSWLQLYKVVAKADPAKPAKPAPAVMAPIDPVDLAERAQLLARQHNPSAPIVSVALDAKGGKPIAVVRFDGVSDPAVIDLDSGKVKVPAAASPTEQSTWRTLHDVALELHTLRFAGIGGNLVGLLLGVMLLFLTGSGLWMWWKMLRERRKRKLKAWLWR
ncbi:MAG: PepSY domain-containing protein [Sphingobium sp.]